MVQVAVQRIEGLYRSDTVVARTYPHATVLQ